jgi:hypothetical protein
MEKTKLSFQVKCIVIAIFVTSVLLISIAYLSAKQVTISQAQLVAKNFYYEHAIVEHKLNYEDIEITDTRTITQNEIPLIYIIDIGENEGFVTLSSFFIEN